MCSSYGIGDPPGRADAGDREAPGRRVRFAEIPPLDRPSSAALLDEWRGASGGRARITGRIARNLNPIVHAAGGRRELALAWWWLHVGGAPAAYSAFNSRDDRLLRSWRGPFQRRAILPATWYVEKGRAFALPGGEPFAIAAITSPVSEIGGDPLLSYSLVTRAAVGAAAGAHPRMPLILPAGFHDEWLDPRRAGDAELVGRAVSASDALSRSLVDAGTRADPREAAGAQPTLF